MNKVRFIYLFLLIILFPVSIKAYDFGLLTSQYMGFGNSEFRNNVNEYRGILVPRLSFLVGETGNFFTSASLDFGINDDGDIYFIPEILRTEFSMQSGGFGIRAGRMSYSDPLDYIATGLFDGVQLTYNSIIGRIGLGAWYTGLLYKDNANIAMNDNDQTKLKTDLDYGNFFKTYFAPSRMLVSLDWEHPSVAGLLRLKTAITGQIDLSSSSEYLNSQYITFKAGVPVNSFFIEAGGSFEMMQNNYENNMAFACELGLKYILPTDFTSVLSFNGRFATGKSDSLLDEFIPVTTVSFGQIFDTKASGLTALSLDYSARLFDSLGGSFTMSYFFRNGSTQFYNYSGANNDRILLGGEIFTKFVWNALSDVQFNIGGGAFFPALGNYWPGLSTQWRIDMSMVLAIY
jgi:hypothetical protein